MPPKKIKASIAKKKDAKNSLKKEIYEKVAVMKQMNEKIAESLVNRIILDAKKTNDLSEEAMDKIRKEMLKEETLKQMVSELNSDLDEIVKDVDKESTTVFELQRAMALLENLTKYMEKKL